MTYAIIIVCIVVIIDRILAAIDINRLERMTEDVMSSNDRTFVDINVRINKLEMKVKESNDNFQHGIGQFDGVHDRFASIEQKINTDNRVNNRSFSSVFDRLDELEKKNNKKRK